MVVNVVGCAWRIIDTSCDHLIIEGTALVPTPVPPTSLVAELESLKNGILMAIHCNIKMLKVLSSSDVVVFIILNDNELDTFLYSVQEMQLIIEIQKIKRIFSLFEISDWVSTNSHRQDLKLMIKDSLALFQNMKRVA